ncbi:PAS domain S-box protein [Flammeovirga sp. MY04]|uniref:PAS domain S-box protein n=1 Tax=Flammeovirga sp. MY04 TaxID=1191459 RepID=UPI0008061ED4|nr:PAS domain S-box protein [Flammeovirga sp. MY04]ANQ49630.1 PAS domain S-box protein [Flammeovirga sp. MY04]
MSIQSVNDELNPALKSWNQHINLLENLAEASILVNKQGIIEFANNAIKELLGYEANSLIGRNVSCLIPMNYVKDHNSRVESFFKNASKRRMGAGSSRPIYAKHFNGKTKHVDISLSPIKIEGEDKIIAIIIDAKRTSGTNSKYQKKIDLYYSLIEHNTDHLFQIDREFKILYINHVSPGLSKEEVLGSSLINLLPNEETKFMVSNVLNDVFTKGLADSYEIDFPSPLGSLHYSTTVTPVIHEGEVIRLNLITRNVTDEYNRKNQLIEWKNFIEKVDLNSQNGIYIYNIKTGTNSYLNKMYTSILGYNLDEVNSFSQAEFMDLFHPNDKEAIAKHMEDVINSKEGETFKIEYRFKAKNGEWIWCRSKDSGFEYDENGKLVSFIGSFIDITDLKDIELQLIHKNKEIKDFVYKATHDIKSPINNMVQMIELSLEDNEPDKEDLEILEHSIHRLKKLVYSLLEYGKSDRMEDVEEIDINKLLDEVLIDINSEIEHSSAEIYYENLPIINASKIGLYRVFQNLLTNAIKFMHKGQKPRITIRCKSQLQHWIFEITDNGIGIPIEKREHIFDAFKKFHSSRKYEGSGLGLANCKKIINLHDGDIWVENNPESEGSTFYFSIKKTL